MCPYIKISSKLKRELNQLKHFPDESFDEIIKDLIDDRKKLSKQTLKDIKISEKQVKKSKVYTYEQIKVKMNERH